MITVNYSFILFLSAWAIFGAHAASCRSPYAQSEDECKALRSWESRNFTPIEELDVQTDFHIIFHSLSGFGWNEDAPKNGSMNGALLRDPSLISSNPKISASLISNKKHTTFVGEVGLILEINPENVVGTSPSDAGSPRLKNNDAAQLSLEMFSAMKTVDI